MIPTHPIVNHVGSDVLSEEQEPLQTKIISASTAEPEGQVFWVFFKLHWSEAQHHAQSEAGRKRHVCVRVCVCVCKAYVSSAQGCYELIANETDSGSCRHYIMEINSLFRSATGGGTCKHCSHSILGKCTTQRHAAVTTVLLVTPSWPISFAHSLRANQ